ncbi:MAG: hypothetical protein HOO98_13205 [Nitrospira sp.]|jgi:hypothetical protein|nr:hypothetical protein [Nitrospira sp.]
MDTHPADQLRKLMTELNREPQLNKTQTKALVDILIDMADRIQTIEQQQGEDY